MQHVRQPTRMRAACVCRIGQQIKRSVTSNQRLQRRFYGPKPWLKQERALKRQLEGASPREQAGNETGFNSGRAHVAMELRPVNIACAG